MIVRIKKWRKRLGPGPRPGVLLLALLVLGGCRAGADESPATLLSLPTLEPVGLEDGEPLAVVATTGIIGDVVAKVGGSAIRLTTLLQAGQDPHSYEPAPSDLRLVADADLIFVNGWQLEEGLLDTLETAAGQVPLVPVSAGIAPLAGAEEDEHSGVDPHVWLDPEAVEQWAENIALALSAADPANAALYQENAAAYRQRLEALTIEMEERLEEVPAGNRRLVTNHQALAYFAGAFGFEVIGTVIPGSSTLAEPSARSLAELAGAMETAGVCTIFTESTVSDSVAQTVAAELEQCDRVQVLPLYTGSLGPPGSGAESYIEMMEKNVETIVSGLR